MKFEKIAEKIHCAANMDYSFYCNSCILHTRMNSQKASNDLSLYREEYRKKCASAITLPESADR